VIKVLELKRVNVFIGSIHVLRNISMHVDKGEIVLLVGRNGAGKTTTLKGILNLVPVKSGSIRFKGQDITLFPPNKIAKLGIGYSPEDSKVFPDLTVEENIKITMWLSGIKSFKVLEDRIYSIFPEIRQFLRRKGLNLSGGEKKLISIARALALDPSLLLLDEPFEGLSPIARARLADGIRKIKSLNISMLLTASNPFVALEIADRIYVIDRGEIIYEGDFENFSKNKEFLLQTIGFI